MGAQLSSLTPTASTVALQSYIDIIPNVQYASTITSSRFLKTVKGLDSNGFVVIKFFIKPEDPSVSIAYTEIVARLDAQQQKLAQLHSCVAFTKIIETDRADYLVRPFIKNNLFERLSLRPFLEKFEKNWICYQLLYAVREFHAIGVYHGDLKTENVLITSWNWCLIADFESFKPVTLPENSSQFSMYFDISKRNSCYLAPERFSDDAAAAASQPALNAAMDLFSLGCVIAELYLDGSSIFTLSQLFRFKRSEYEPNLNNIDDLNVRNMIQDLIQLDPARRLSADAILSKYEDKIFPRHFSQQLYPYMKGLTSYKTPNLKSYKDRFQECDYKIDKIYENFSSLIQRHDDSPDASVHANGTNYGVDIDTSVIPITLNLPNTKPYKPVSTSKAKQDPTALILLSVVCSAVRNTTHSSFRIKSCDLFVALAEFLQDESKLDRCLPYLMYLLEDPCADVKVAALRAITQLLYMCDSVTAMNISIWPEYILPKLSLFVNAIKDEEDGFVKAQFATYLPFLMTAALKFDAFVSVMNMDYTPTQNATIVKEFENFTLNLLTDQNSNVRIAFLQNISEICQFFDKDKTNDLILSHLITYLNDKDPNLRISFIGSILPLSMFTGMASFEQYILPLLVQTINDPDELVVFKILQTFNQLVKLNFVSKSKVWDLVRIVVKLLLHPNEWIRRHTLTLIISICDRLSLADLYCILYPIIRPFFQYDVTVFSFESLYPCLARPLTRSVYRLAITWAQAQDQFKTEKSLFWQRQTNPKIDSFGNSGMSFMVKTQNNYHFNDSYVVTRNHEIPLSAEDKTWVQKLSNSGLQEQDLWKLATMRDYIYRVSRANSKRLSYQDMTVNDRNGMGNKNSSADDMQLQKLGVLPKTLFFEVIHKSDVSAEAYRNKTRSNNVSRVTSPSPIPLLAFNSVDNDLYSRSASPPTSGFHIQQQQQFLLGGKMTKAPPSLHEDRGNAFAMAQDLDQLNINGGSIRRASHGGSSITEADKISEDKDADDTEGDQDMDDNTIIAGDIITTVQHNYKGKNPYILKFLSTFEFEPTLDDYVEFGPSISSSSEKINEVEKSNPTDSNKTWQPKGVLVAHLTEHKASCNSCVVSADENYFITGDNDGVLKIWDSLRLERNVTGSSSLSMSLDSPIKAMCMVPDRDCVAVALKNGAVKIFKILFEVKGRNRFNRLLLIRDYKLLDEYALQVEICEDLMMMATTSSRLIGIDIKNMAQKFLLQNDLSHGVITSFVMDPKKTWLLCSTNHGFLDLWDLRFEINLKKLEWSKPGNLFSISQDSKKLKKNKLVLFKSLIDDEVSIIDVSKFNQSSQKHGSSSALFAPSASSTQLRFIQYNKASSYLVTTTQENDLVYWNLRNPDSDSKYLLRQDMKLSISETQTNNDAVLRFNLVHSFIEPNDLNARKRKSKYAVSAKSMDRINDIKFIRKPYDMVVAVDRSGCINVYR